MQLGSAIRQIRKKRNISQKEFAQLIDKTPSYLSLIETNQKTPSMELLRNISKSLQIPFYYLLFKSIDVENEVPKHKQDTYKHISPFLDSMMTEIFFDEQ